MDAKEFFIKVAEMRRLQKEYFRKRDALVLKKAKDSEREIDNEIKRVNDSLQMKLDL